MGHHRATACQSPGTGKGPPGCASTGWAGTGRAGTRCAGTGWAGTGWVGTGFRRGICSSIDPYSM
jgi:hypothetical protein